MTVITCDDCGTVMTAPWGVVRDWDGVDLDLCREHYEARMQAAADKADAELVAEGAA